MRWAGHVEPMGEGTNMYMLSVGKPKRKKHLKDQRIDGRIGIKMDLREIGWTGVEWIHLAQDRDFWQALVNAVMNLQVLVPRN
jgi:hypothetical protein